MIVLKNRKILYNFSLRRNYEHPFLLIVILSNGKTVNEELILLV